MAEMQFLHGPEVVISDAGPRTIRTVRSSVIGIVGTAPDADPEVFPVSKPVLIAGSRIKAASLDMVGDKAGTLPNALDLILDQIGAVVVVVRVEEGVDDDATLTNILGGATADGGYEGVHALLAANSDEGVGQTPRILCVPVFTGFRPEDPDNPGTYLANPVVAELLGIAQRLRAHIIADGPSTNDSAALAYAQDWGDRRVYVVDPRVKVRRPNGIVSEAGSAAVAGLIARIDNERGWWWSPSNQNVNGIIGVERPIDFRLGDPNSRANLLNEGNVATFVREDGWRLWGNRTCSSDQRFAFLSVSRATDIINDSILEAHLWAVDRNITKNYFESVSESVNLYLSTLASVGAIIKGECYPDPELNDAASIPQGKVWFNVRWTPVYPAEHIIFKQSITNDFLDDLI